VTDADLDAVRSKLARATDAADDEATRLLADARDDIDDLRDENAVDEERLDALAAAVNQRLRERSERDAYDGGAPEGAAMNPEDEDAP
jgi:hypothetical protein